MNEDRTAMYERAAARIEQRSAPEPTPERTPPARETTGQFRSSERPTGREAEERAQGFRPLKEDRDEPEGLTVRDAATDRAKAHQERPIEVHESGLDDDVTLSAIQAAKRITEAREAEAKQAEIDGTKAAQKAVDDLRGETPAEVGQPQQIEAEPDIERALSHPKVRDAITAKVTEAETQRAAYEAGLWKAADAQVSAIGADFPELANLDHSKWADAINAMAQREPARARQIASRLQSLAQVESAMLQLKAQKAERQQSEMKAYTAREDQRFAELTKHIPPAEMKAIKAEIPHMFKEYGITDQRAFLAAIQGQTSFPRGSAERILADAAKFRLLMKAAKPTPARVPLPPVVRPGAGGPRTNPAAANLQALNAALAKGDLKAAGKYIAANRAAKRR
jgi:hypothetical protein